MKATSTAPDTQVSPNTISNHFTTEKRKYIDQHFEIIEWRSPDTAIIRCPGAELHSNPTSHKDTFLFSDGCPTIHCFHSSCEDVVKEKNRSLRAALEQITCGNRHQRQKLNFSSPFQRMLPDKSKLEEAAQRSKSLILEQYPWSITEILNESPYTIPSDPLEQFRLQLGIYSPGKNETIFHGGLTDSGHPRHRANFLSAAQSKSLPMHLGEFISQSSYEKDCYQRTTARIRKRLVFVVECDGIDEAVRDKISRREKLTDEDKVRNKEASCAVYRWMKEAVGMRLLWVVDSGNKSLHAAFELPDKATINELEVILPVFGADSKMFNGNQLTRAAGARREENGSIQELLYCDPITL